MPQTIVRQIKYDNAIANFLCPILTDDLYSIALFLDEKKLTICHYRTWAQKVLRSPEKCLKAISTKMVIVAD